MMNNTTDDDELNDEAIAMEINQVFEDLHITYLPSPNGDGDSFDTQRPHRIEVDCGVGLCW